MIKDKRKNSACPAKPARPAGGLERSEGVVLLFAVTLTSILLAIAVGISNIALKELNFSTSARAANDAFFAADTGAECALFYDRSVSSTFAQGSPPTQTINCAGQPNITVTKSGTGPISWVFKVP